MLCMCHLVQFSRQSWEPILIIPPSEEEWGLREEGTHLSSPQLGLTISYPHPTDGKTKTL